MKRLLLIALVLSVFTISVMGYCAEDKPFFSAELIFEPGSAGFKSCHGSTLAELPNGDIIAAWYGGSFEKAKDVAIYASRLDMKENKWNKPWIIQDVPDKSEGNPVLWHNGKDTLWLFYVTIMKTYWNEARMFYKTSKDEGLTWSEPVVLMKPLGWMTRNKPIVIDNGDILLPVYNEILFDSAFLISSDAGKTWRKSSGIKAPGGNIQPSAVQLADGSLITGMRTGSKNGYLWWAVSKSRGKSWEKPYTADIKNPGSGTDMVMLKNGHIALAYNDSSTDRNPLNVAISTDGGKTWPYNRIIETDQKGGSFAYPAIIQDSTGRIHVTFSFNRDSIKHAIMDEAWVMSKDQ